MNIESAILYHYKEQSTTDEPDTDLLFDVISNYIRDNNWVYEGSANQQNVWLLQEQSDLEVNCFMLTDLFVQMSKVIAVNLDECLRVEIPHFVSRIHENHTPFFSTLTESEDGIYEFDVHCIAMIKGYCFDLVLQKKYLLLNHEVDIYSSLYGLLINDDLDEFEHILPYLLDVNEQCHAVGWTLMHHAINMKKYDFAKLLLKNGAQDNIYDQEGITPLSILNADMYDPSVSLETLCEIREYLDLKIGVLINNKTKEQEHEEESNTATATLSFWG